ncbi:uncharacterized protein [Gossypium hirsutum]|uniref:Retrotransposon gag domain-containing protein n=1 Tax=Gossypium hirsutum TaxID=3635 RepID=A0ABM2ZHT1_GOSHI|nr:uncharacterized protein LOC121213519 [Gossypium hirsutum]
MSARRGARGRGRGRESVRAELSALSHVPIIGVEEAPTSPVGKNEQYNRAAGDDALSLAMLRILERATKRIMEDLDCSPEQKLKGAVSLLKEEAYQWWLTVKEDTQPEQVTWEFFKAAFQGKYLGASYVDIRRKEFLNLTQGNKSVAEYEAEFLRLNRYARVMVAMDYEHCVRFEDGLRDSLRVLIALQREQVFSEFVEKAKIAEEVKRTECLYREKEMGKNKREVETPGIGQRIRARARVNGPIRVGPPAANPGDQELPKMLAQVPIAGRGGAQPLRGGQLPPRCRGQAKGGNSNGRGHEAPGKNTGHAKVRQPALVYAARHREDGDALDVITGMFFIYELPYTALIDIGSTHSYVACNMTEPLGDMFEITSNEMTVISSLGQSMGLNKLFREVS